MNAAARIEEACKELQQQFLASAAVISALDLPSDFAAESLGQIELRGIQDSVELFAMTREADRPTTA